MFAPASHNEKPSAIPPLVLHRHVSRLGSRSLRKDSRWPTSRIKKAHVHSNDVVTEHEHVMTGSAAEDVERMETNRSRNRALGPTR
jgi:hypothetical protein